MARPKKNDPKVLKRFQQELKRSIDWRRSEGMDDKWDSLVDLYRGVHYKGKSESDRMVINRAFRTKNVIAPSVAVNNPKFLVAPKDENSGMQAYTVEEVLNYLWRVHRYQDEFRLAVDDQIIVGFGWIKIGYKFKARDVKVVTAPKQEDENKDEEETEPGVDDRAAVEGNVETERKIVDDRPFIERISYKDLFVDPDGRNMQEIRWIAQRIRRPVSDVLVDRRYDAKIRQKAQHAEADATTPSSFEDSRPTGQNPASKGMVDVWEYYDIRESTVSTFIMEIEEGFLIPPAPTPYPFGHPFEMLRNYNVPDHFYPMGDLESIEPLQKELNKTRTEMMLHRRGNQRKYITKPGAFTPEQLRNLQSDEDNIVVEMAQPDLNPNEAIAPMPSHSIAPDAYNMSDIISNDIDDTTGVTDFAQSAIRRTATEAAMIQDQLNARSADKLAQVELCLSRVAEKLVMMMQTYMQGNHVIRMVGTESEPLWIRYDRDFMKGDFDFLVEAGSTQPMNESFRAQRALQMMDAMGMFVEMGIVNPMALARKVLMDGFGVKDASKFLEEQGPPPQEQGAPPGGPMPPGGPGGPGGPPPGPGGPPPGPGGPPMGQLPPELMAQMMGDQSPIEGIPAELLGGLNIEASPVMQRRQGM